ncbi:MAG: hypothetical protein WC312_03925 [Candidatus Omnitrophota bacterium]|jgi:hypothetical protein
MEKHCTSLEISKQLKETGWKKETEFWWIEDKSGNNKILLYSYKQYINLDAYGCRDAQNNCYPAPLATEILEELPSFIQQAYKYNLTIEKLGDEYSGFYQYSDRDCDYLLAGMDGAKFDKSLPNALAKMWLYLKKEGII